MRLPQRISRRSFLTGTAGAVGAAVAAPCVVPSIVFGANDRIFIGHIGVGHRGGVNLKRFLSQTAAVCDVDKKHAERAREMVVSNNGKCDVYTDFRKLLDRKDIDAVVVSTPDHWHALPTVLACEAGKDVYVEKPMTLTIAEGRAMVEAARRNKRIVQTGSQQRSMARFRYACELVRSGRIGKLQTVKVGIDGNIDASMLEPVGEPVPDCDPPEWLDYDFWLGPAPRRPYNPRRVHYHYRWWWDYSGGQLTNWGAHHLDIAQWGMGTDGSGPLEIEGNAKYHEDGWIEVPVWYHVTYKYAGGLTVLCGPDYQKSHGDGVTFIGSKGTVHVNRGEISSEPAEIIKEPIGDTDVHLYKSTNHDDNWLQCIKTRKLPVCDVAIGHRSATVCHLGNIAIRTGRVIKWDPVKEQIIGDEEANRMLSRPYRSPWKL